MTLAALEATLQLALDPALAGDRIPLWAFLNVARESLLDRAGSLAETLRSEFGLEATVIESTAFLGGGSAPLEPIPTAVVRVGPPFPAGSGSEGDWARTLRLGDPPVVTRVQGGAVLFDLRAVLESDDASIVEAVRLSIQSTSSPNP
jgi:L-seryl-tRNA(Ser) seleniumtransferase